MKTYTVEVSDTGSKWWYLNGQRHREDGPACEWVDGTKHWYLNDKLHREDGPAVECADGTKRWYLNDNPHREDGPAVDWADGSKQWFLNGKELSKAQFDARTKQKPSCEGKVVEVDGIKYKLTKA